MEEVEIGMPVKKLLEVRPKAIPLFMSDTNARIVKTPLREVLIYERFPDSSLFNHATYMAVDGKIMHMMLGYKSSNHDSRGAVDTVVQRAIRAYGNDFDSLISMSDKRIPSPTLVWRKPVPISLSYKPADIEASKWGRFLYLLTAHPDISAFKKFTKPLADQERLFRLESQAG